MVFDRDGRLLLIRNRYGNAAAFVLPGGGIKWREAAIDAAEREVLEETGCAIHDLTFIATYRAIAEGKRDTVHLFCCMTNDVPRADGIEVSEARYFSLDDLPPTTSPATRRRIEEYSGQRTRNGSW